MEAMATNRKIGELIRAVGNASLLPQPKFQRRLVWTDKHKQALIDTVLKGYPFPEIYIASGPVNVETGQVVELLVDGQQRVTTLHDYFRGNASWLGRALPAYESLAPTAKEAFLEYKVVVRDLGSLAETEIREVFARINSTQYSLNAMELHNAHYDGELIHFAKDVAESSFFETHRVFSTNEIRRMHDMRFALGFIITVMSSYFNRDDALEDYLDRYNNSFPGRVKWEKEIGRTLKFIEKCALPAQCRVWKKADLFTVLVETHRTLHLTTLKIKPDKVSTALQAFYRAVEHPTGLDGTQDDQRYAKAALQATNDRANRVARGEIIQSVIAGTVATRALM